MGGLEKRKADVDPVIVYSVAQDINRATLVELLAKAVAEVLEDTGRPAMDFQEALPDRWLRLLNKGEHLRRI